VTQRVGNLKGFLLLAFFPSHLFSDKKGVGLGMHLFRKSLFGFFKLHQSFSSTQKIGRGALNALQRLQAGWVAEGFVPQLDTWWVDALQVPAE
jgi:hypothetical protein